MAYICYDKLWRSEVYNSVSAKDKVQDINLNQLKLKVNDPYKKDEKKTKKIEHSDDSDGRKTLPRKKTISTIEGQILYIEKNYNEFKLLTANNL